MTDIVKVLRSSASVFYEYSADNGALLKQAADEIEKLRAALQTARRDALEKLERHFKEAAAGTPLGHENRQRGASTYNWLIYCASIIRALGEKE
jgi:hypothetical protein